MDEASNIVSELSNTLLEQAEKLKELSGQKKTEGYFCFIVIVTEYLVH